MPHSLRALCRPSPVSPMLPPLPPGDRIDEVWPQGRGQKPFKILVSSPSWHLLLTKPNQPENGFPKSDVKSVALTSARQGLVASQMAHGFRAWGMYPAQRFMNPQNQQNKTKLFLTGTNRPAAVMLGLAGQPATLLPLVSMTEGKTHSSWAALLWTVARVTSAAAPFLRILLSLKKHQ